VLVVGLVAFALLRLNLHRVGHALITASPEWIALALVLMAVSLVMRSISWHQTLRAAMPETPIPWLPVMRATMIGVMGSAVFPGRVGEATRVLVLSRRLEGSTRRQIPIVAGTVFSQTLINLLALAILLAVTFSRVPLLHGNLAGVAGALLVPLAICLLVIAGPRLLVIARRSKRPRIADGAALVTRLLTLARQGLSVFARPRYGFTAVFFQLLAWALQWLSCYCVLVALGLQSQAGLVGAAAILLAVNLSAVVPATPSNVGVFQAACVVVLAAFEVSAGAGVAYGILLQAVEVVTALALGIPALLGEGLTWQDIRPAPEPVGASGEEAA
jgi:phosphatidylinositol alpha-mannosyltransferase